MYQNPSVAEQTAAVREHSRIWRENKFVYPVISRRAKGLSIGINLNPSKVCTFNCVYCQVDRTVRPVTSKVDLGTLIRELNEMMDWVKSGEIWKDPTFAEVPAHMHRVNDVAFSGDGEPTAFRNFPDVVQIAADAKVHHSLKSVKLVVISNASRFHTKTFRRALPILQSSMGEVWAKLDAGSASHFAKVNRTRVPYKRIIENIEWLSKQMAVVIQSCFFRMDGQGPSPTEIELYIARLRKMIDEGGHLKCIQLYTVARRPAESNVKGLGHEDLDRLANQIRDRVGGIPVETYYGKDAPPKEKAKTL